MRKIRIFLLRCRIAFKIIFNEKHVIAIYLKEQHLVSLIQKDHIRNMKIDFGYCGMMEHQAKRSIMEVAEKLDNTDVICQKAQFEIDYRTKMHIAEEEC